MRLTLALLVAAAAVVSPAAASPPPTRCAVLADAAGDVALVAPEPTPATAPGNVDVRAVRVKTTGAGLTFTIDNTTLDEQRRAIWRVTFDGGGAHLFVAAGTGVWANVGDGDTVAGFRAGVTGGRSHAVRGFVDYARGTVRVDVPFSAFDRVRIRRGSVLTAFAVEAKETFVAFAPDTATEAEIKLSDTATSKRTFTVGRTC